MAVFSDSKHFREMFDRFKLTWTFDPQEFFNPTSPVMAFVPFQGYELSPNMLVEIIFNLFKLHFNTEAEKIGLENFSEEEQVDKACSILNGIRPYAILVKEFSQKRRDSRTEGPLVPEWIEPALRVPNPQVVETRYCTPTGSDWPQIKIIGPISYADPEKERLRVGV